MIKFEDKPKIKKNLIETEGTNNDTKIPSMSLEEFLDTAKELKKEKGEFSTVIVDSFNNINE